MREDQFNIVLRKSERLGRRARWCFSLERSGREGLNSKMLRITDLEKLNLRLNLVKLSYVDLVLG